MLARLVGLLGAMGAAATAALPAQEVGPANGALVIVGGGQLDAAILQRFLELAGGRDAPIVVIPTAGGAQSYDQYWTGLRGAVLLPGAGRRVRPQVTDAVPAGARAARARAGRQGALARALNGARL